MKNLFFFIFFAQTLLTAQVNKQDSLVILLKNTKEEKTQALLYTQLAKLYEHSKSDSAVYYAQKGNELSIKIGFDLGVAENTAALGDIFVIKDQLDKAKANYIIAADLFLK